MGATLEKKFTKGKVDIILKGGGADYTNVEAKESTTIGSPNGKLYIGFGPGAPNVNKDDSIVIINTVTDHISGLIAAGKTDVNNQTELVINQPMEIPLFTKLVQLSGQSGGNQWTGVLSNYFKVTFLS